MPESETLEAGVNTTVFRTSSLDSDVGSEPVKDQSGDMEGAGDKIEQGEKLHAEADLEAGEDMDGSGGIR